MGDGEEGSSDVLQRIQSSFGTSPSSIPRQSSPTNFLDMPHLSHNQIRSNRHFSHFGQHFNGAAAQSANKRVGIPPSHPNQIPPISPYSRPSNQQTGSQSFSPVPTHSRSLSQPSSFFSLDSLPPLSPTTFSDQVSTNISMGDGDVYSLLPPSPFSGGNSPRVCESLPPRRSHRRSNSDIPFGLSTIMQSSPLLIPPRGAGGLEGSVSVKENMGVPKPAQLVRKGTDWERGANGNGEGMLERNSEGEVVDDLFCAYMNLDNIDLRNSADDKNNGNEHHEDFDSRTSGAKTNGGDSSDNEAGSSGNSAPGVEMNSNSTEKREGNKRSAGVDIAPTGRHYRSVSMDSFIGKLNLDDESPKSPSSPGSHPGKLSPTISIDKNSAAFTLEFGNGDFSGAELKKIMANEELADIAMTDPKRAKRILANRQSAARSKERKMRYISELEHKVQILQTEATSLSAQITLLQRDSVGLTNQNNELRFRLQAMEQQTKLRNALSEALTAEVQRLKLATQELSGDSDPSKGMVSQQLSDNHQLFQLNIPHQFQQRQQTLPPAQPQQPNGNTSAKSESNHSF
ncbi:hypothetical protein V6N13_130737 [Hibiscus sabdariffa]|uniref:BZIP domain-containing protein n=1 Tax=Hibiscus sabdariffa TaxID=183260 RepID=A0ABR2BPR9_9ROSI